MITRVIAVINIETSDTDDNIYTSFAVIDDVIAAHV